MGAHWKMTVGPHIEDYTPYAERVGKHFAAKAGLHREVDEFVSEAYVGLMDAFRKFDPERGLKFPAFAYPRIRGQLLDFMRDRCKRGIGGSRGVPRRLVSLNEINYLTDPEAEGDITYGIEFQETVDSIARRIPGPSGKNGKIAVKRYLSDPSRLRMRLAGESVGLSESRVSQIVADLREILRDDPEFGPLARRYAGG